MTATDFKPSTSVQRKEIMRNSSYQIDTKNEWVQWVTGDNSKTSLTAISFDQANQILAKQTGTAQPKENWAFFDKNNPKHNAILSLMYQAQWTVPNARHEEVPDLERLSDFLKSDKSPVKKPLKLQTQIELSKTIKALEGIVKHRFK
ncbi:hypothetical protein FNO01nite_30230 [Flavobacterium noncentrifugens]|uniref:Uncharacterized protein n=1 Tax=Flavobacterium noncentrifugens TaxID=1128970 RepID=A0A1G9BSE3_9FLAO|nr:hypothetical protein [Flavobacterium noncentrifugens]GEP52351.1 hypothetical protein FNO01nite_30230 [Flavobacterium noncentrifugens]SDK42408.1 hypothetical protein SAMN04487935_3336 [Flavobacterium noncentrifugens]